MKYQPHYLDMQCRIAAQMSLRSWLSSAQSDQIFWVKGKPGSGKSTLMKAVRDHRDLTSLLLPWTDGKDPIVAAHSFWIAGAAMQKSVEGLIRALLHGIVSALDAKDDQDLELLKMIQPDPWLKKRKGPPWGYQKLTEMLDRACSNVEVKILFIIDGLDECDASEHSQLLSILVGLRAHVGVKVLVSSRPWPIFVRQLSAGPQILIQDLTCSEMRTYAQDILTEAEASQQLPCDFRQRSSNACKLVLEIVSRAEGVFLWTALVLKELASEVRKGRSAAVLIKSVFDYPNGIEEYFRKRIFERVAQTEKNRVDTANVLKLLKLIETHGLGCYAGGETVAISLLCRGDLFHSEELHDPEWYTQDEANARMLQVKSFLRETCGDLVEVARKCGSLGTRDVDLIPLMPLTRTITFLHRTAFDFLHEGATSTFIEANCNARFREDGFLDRLAALCLATVLRQENLLCDVTHSLLTQFARSYGSSNRNINTYVKDRRKCEALILDQLDRYCDHQRCTTHWSPHTSQMCFSSDLRQYPLAVFRKTPTLIFQGNGQVEFTRTNLLIWLALHEDLDVAKLDLRFLGLILELGCHPNDIAEVYSACYITIWESFVLKWVTPPRTGKERTRKSGIPKIRRTTGAPPIDEDGEDKLANAMMCLLEAGADPECAPCLDHEAFAPHQHICRRMPLEQIILTYVPARWQSQLLEKLAQASQASTQRYRFMRQKLRGIRSLRTLEPANSLPSCQADFKTYRKFLFAWLPGLSRSFCCDACDLELQLRVCTCLDCVGMTILCENCARDHSRSQNSHHMVGWVMQKKSDEGFRKPSDAANAVRKIYDWFALHAQAHDVDDWAGLTYHERLRLDQPIPVAVLAQDP